MKSISRGVLAIVLLGIYAYLIFKGCAIVSCVSSGRCTAYTSASFNDVMAQALSLIGGLVSAYIIAVLAITEQGSAPVAGMLSPDASARSKNVLKWVTGFYVLVWIVAGLSALVMGMNHPGVLPALTNVGQSWLGLAIAATYSYFGISPSKT